MTTADRPPEVAHPALEDFHNLIALAKQWKARALAAEAELNDVRLLVKKLEAQIQIAVLPPSLDE